MEIWKAGKDVMDLMLRLIAEHHPHLAMIESDIGIVFREKAIEKNGKTILGVTKKAPPMLSVLTDKKFNYKFIVELGADAWQTLSDRQRMALIDHHLCSMSVEEDEDKGTLSCSMRPPDFLGYKEEVERWGMWRPLDDDTLTALEHMFDTKDGDRSSVADDISDALDVLSR